MSVETIYKVALHPFINESIASLKAMAHLSGSSADAFMDKVEDFRFKGYAVCSEVSGCINGVIMCSFSWMASSSWLLWISLMVDCYSKGYSYLMVDGLAVALVLYWYKSGFFILFLRMTSFVDVNVGS